MKRALILLHVIFVFVGIANTILGPLLPLLAQRWALTDRASGLLFLAMFLGGFTGALVSTRLGRRFTLHALARVGLLLIAAGFALLATSLQEIALLAFAAIGIGLGFTNPAINTLASEAVPDRRAAILNLLNFAWALGAIAAPPLLLAGLRHTRFNVQALLGCFALVMVVSAFFMPAISISKPAEREAASSVPRGLVRLIAACAILAFIYVGVENGLTGWLPTFATRVRGLPYERSALLQGTFWTAFLLGRLAAPAFLRAVTDRLLLTLSMLLALLGSVSLLLTARLMFLSVALIGLGCAAIFPTAIAVLSQRLSGAASSQLGFVFASAGLGAATLPFLIGTLSTALHSLAQAMWLIVTAEVLLLLAHAFMSSLVARRDALRFQSNAAAQ